MPSREQEPEMGCCFPKPIEIVIEPDRPYFHPHGVSLEQQFLNLPFAEDPTRDYERAVVDSSSKRERISQHPTERELQQMIGTRMFGSCIRVHHL